MFSCWFISGAGFQKPLQFKYIQPHWPISPQFSKMQAQTRRYSVVGSIKKIVSSDKNSHVQPAAAQDVGSVSSNLLSPQQLPSSPAALQPPTPESTPFRTPKRSAPASEPHTPETTPPRVKRQDQKPSPRRDFSSKFASAGRWLRRSSQLLSPSPLPVRPPVVREQPTISSKVPASLQPAFDVRANSELNNSGAEITHNLSSAQGDCSRSLSMSPRTDRKDAKAVLTVIKQLRDETYRVKKGDKDKYSIQRKLQYRGYKLLRDPELLKEVDGPDSDLLEYIDRYLRFEYLRDPLGNDRQFVIRMPSAFHETMAWGFGDIIRTWLDDITRGEHLKSTVKKTRDWTMKVASNIESTGATRIRLQELGNSMEPDASYKHKICSIPDLLVEVSWSQRGKMLPRRAKRLIEEMDGRVRTVIGLDMSDIYKGGRKATFSVWKAKSELNDSREEKWTVHTVINNQEFINERGEPVEGCELGLSLKDFICQHTQRNWGKKGENYIFEDVPVKIPARTLFG
ncbi:hypothetical protein F5883DRAFT_575832 [Diaporthe sp. PMI_573]|nr:hypothetical protein F5883DRAFT_575832 [Diaporthaceae sp. PMI_573]